MSSQVLKKQIQKRNLELSSTSQTCTVQMLLVNTICLPEMLDGDENVIKMNGRTRFNNSLISEIGFSKVGMLKYTYNFKFPIRRPTVQRSRVPHPDSGLVFTFLSFCCRSKGECLPL